MPLLIPPSYDFLGSIVLAGAAVTTGVLTFDAYDELLVQARITGMSAIDQPALRFNGDATTTNYRSRWVTFSNVAVPANAGLNFATSGHIVIASSSSTTDMSAEVGITNLLGVNKMAQIQCAYGVATQGTVPGVRLGWAQWFNTAAQITSMELRTDGGVNTLSAGSGFAVFGRRF